MRTCDLNKRNGSTHTDIEMGNEFYLSQYQYEFPNSKTYMEKILPVISTVRSELPNAAIAVVTANPYNTGSVDTNWNKGIASYAPHYDAVTIHDYTLNDNKVSGLKYVTLSAY